MGPNPQFPANLVTCTGEILNVKLHFFVQCKNVSTATQYRKVTLERVSYLCDNIATWVLHYISTSN